MPWQVISSHPQNPYKNLDMIACVSATPALGVRVGGQRWVETGGLLGLANYRLSFTFRERHSL